VFSYEISLILVQMIDCPLNNSTSRDCPNSLYSPQLTINQKLPPYFEPVSQNRTNSTRIKQERKIGVSLNYPCNQLQKLFWEFCKSTAYLFIRIWPDYISKNNFLVFHLSAIHRAKSRKRSLKQKWLLHVLHCLICVGSHSKRGVEGSSHYNIFNLLSASTC